MSHETPLAQVEVLLIFSPRLQTGDPRPIKDIPPNASQGWMTLDVFGIRGTSELTGRPILEDMRLESHGEDIEPLLPDSLVNAIAYYVLED